MKFSIFKGNFLHILKNCSTFGRRLDYVNKEFYVLVAVRATADSLRALTPHNIHRIFFGALSASPTESTFALLCDQQAFMSV